MNFNVASKTSGFDANNAYTDICIDRTTNQGTTRIYSLSGLFGDDVIGLNASKIPDIKLAIIDMCNAIDTKLNEIKTDIDSNFAYRGEDAALKEYLGKVAKYCSNFTSSLRNFNDKLTDVKYQWDVSTGLMESQIDSDIES